MNWWDWWFLRGSGDSLVESERMCDGACSIPFVCYCKGERRRKRGEKVRERACQPTRVMKNAWRLWCQFAGAKAAEKEHRQGFLNSATLAVCTLTHPASLCLSFATAHFISPARQLYFTCAFFSRFHWCNYAVCLNFTQRARLKDYRTINYWKRKILCLPYMRRPLTTFIKFNTVYRPFLRPFPHS